MYGPPPPSGPPPRCVCTCFLYDGQLSARMARSLVRNGSGMNLCCQLQSEDQGEMCATATRLFVCEYSSVSSGIRMFACGCSRKNDRMRNDLSEYFYRESRGDNLEAISLVFSSTALSYDGIFLLKACFTGPSTLQNVHVGRLARVCTVSRCLPIESCRIDGDTRTFGDCEHGCTSHSSRHESQLPEVTPRLILTHGYLNTCFIFYYTSRLSLTHATV